MSSKQVLLLLEVEEATSPPPMSAACSDSSSGSSNSNSNSNSNSCSDDQPEPTANPNTATSSSSRSTSSSSPMTTTGSTTTTAATTTSASKGKMMRKCVTFGQVIIHEFPVMLGDNPSVSKGAPLCLSWDCSKSDVYEIDFYEYIRLPDRKEPRKRLILSNNRRMKLLLNAGHSVQEIAAVAAQVQEDKQLRAKHAIEATATLKDKLKQGKIMELLSGAAEGTFTSTKFLLTAPTTVVLDGLGKVVIGTGKFGRDAVVGTANVVRDGVSTTSKVVVSGGMKTTQAVGKVVVGTGKFGRDAMVGTANVVRDGVNTTSKKVVSGGMATTQAVGKVVVGTGKFGIDAVVGTAKVGRDVVRGSVNTTSKVVVGSAKGTVTVVRDSVTKTTQVVASGGKLGYGVVRGSVKGTTKLIAGGVSIFSDSFRELGYNMDDSNRNNSILTDPFATEEDAEQLQYEEEEFDPLPPQQQQSQSLGRKGPVESAGSSVGKRVTSRSRSGGRRRTSLDNAAKEADHTTITNAGSSNADSSNANRRNATTKNEKFIPRVLRRSVSLKGTMRRTIHGATLSAADVIISPNYRRSKSSDLHQMQSYYGSSRSTMDESDDERENDDGLVDNDDLNDGEDDNNDDDVVNPIRAILGADSAIDNEEDSLVQSNEPSSGKTDNTDDDIMEHSTLSSRNNERDDERLRVELRLAEAEETKQDSEEDSSDDSFASAELLPEKVESRSRCSANLFVVGGVEEDLYFT